MLHVFFTNLVKVKLIFFFLGLREYRRLPHWVGQFRCLTLTHRVRIGGGTSAVLHDDELPDTD